MFCEQPAEEELFGRPNAHDASPVLSTITSTPRASKPASLQDIVTYDAGSLFVKGERIFMLAGEYAPFRHPVPSVWLDASEKVKALGFNAISFYVAWFLVEGKHGAFPWKVSLTSKSCLRQQLRQGHI
ncbi:hypothetical protein AARAC_007625 [Aspergillus arachidicola]|uniref:Glycoside hydrolase 35 catalytic domain-containing protein n=1 Tax=Aspergillus arachidicola TaxID=656916 RepID=A0A2G7FFQ6_9EURO|nr:hypothetical protein AARAC_007625 [Aspergillus arachidicola]